MFKVISDIKRTCNLHIDTITKLRTKGIIVKSTIKNFKKQIIVKKP